MRRLVETGLLFGNLEHVNTPHMVARYNAALDGLGIPPTSLESFQIDASGYSPEVAAEKADAAYLDPQGVNRRYIILGPKQRNLPIIRAYFSADQAVFRQFFDANMRSIETLTLHDAVYGEMENLLLSVEKPADILGLNRIDFSIRTPTLIAERAARLAENISKFESDPSAWRDADIINSIVDDAKVCGDIRKNGILPSAKSFSWPDMYHTKHFGGVHVIRRNGKNTVVGHPGRLLPKPPNSEIIDISDALTVGRMLESEGLLEDFNRDWLLGSGVLQHRMNMAAAVALIAQKRRFEPEAVTDEKACSRLIQSNIDVLAGNQRFRALYDMNARLVNDDGWKDHYRHLPATLKMALLRALPDIPEVWEVNRLLAVYCEFDPVSLFIVNKSRFYERYQTICEREKALAVHSIKTIYQPDTNDLLRHKHSVRERFFGTH